MKKIFFSCSGMFRDFPECSGMFRNVPLSSAEASLCCGEAGEKEKESARGSSGRWMRDFPSSPARFLFFRLFISIFIGIPSGSLCGGEGKSLKKIRPGPPAYSKLTCRVWYMARISAVTTSRNLPRDTTFFSVPSAIVSHGTLLPVNIWWKNLTFWFHYLLSTSHLGFRMRSHFSLM